MKSETAHERGATVGGQKGGGVREFFGEQFPLIVIVFGAAFLAAYLQHGFLPGGDRTFPVAGVAVPIWHLFWMGFWTGYTMALVGEAAGIFALPYTMSVLQFANLSVTPTTQLLTLLNPLGALFGFRRNRQWNLDLALWVCVGGMAGGVTGPFVRLYLLADAGPFTFVVGLALVAAGAHLTYAAFGGFRRHDAIAAKFAAEANRRRSLGLSPSGLPGGVVLETVSRRGRRLTVGFWEETWTINLPFLAATGGAVGVISAALGVGGGFLLVPILAAVYRLPMYVLVAATIPYVIVLSATALTTYGLILPAITGVSIEPEWAWGLFAASGGILGSWLASKTQRFVPQHFLKLMLGSVTGSAGALYVVDLFFPLPFRF